LVIYRFFRKPKLEDKLFSFLPEVTAIFTALAIGYSHHKNVYVPQGREADDELLIFMLKCLFLSYLGIGIAMNNHGKNALFKNIGSSKEEKIARIHQLLSWVENKVPFYAQVGALYGELGKYDEALYHYKLALSDGLPLPSVFGFPPLDLAVKLYMQTAFYLVSPLKLGLQKVRKKDTIQDYLEFILSNSIYSNRVRVKQGWGLLYDRFKSELNPTQHFELRTLQAICLDALAEHDESETIWQETIDGMIQSERASL